MDDMYRTVQVACKMAKRAHNREKRVHVIFKEVGLWRIKPVEEIGKICQKAIYGWTKPVWYSQALHPGVDWHDLIRQLPMGDDCLIRKQFEKDCYYPPTMAGLTLYDEYTHDEICHCLQYGQGLLHDSPPFSVKVHFHRSASGL